MNRLPGEQIRRSDASSIPDSLGPSRVAGLHDRMTGILGAPFPVLEDRPVNVWNRKGVSGDASQKWRDRLRVI
jgi:hypothetical protein